MRLLLDTHIYLWWLQDSRQLSKDARAKIMSADDVFISSASIWEAAIKVGIGKLEVDVGSLVKEIAKSGFQELPVSVKHAEKIMSLPDIHRDPFDRLLIAQAMCEPLRFLTMDRTLKDYTSLVELV